MCVNLGVHFFLHLPTLPLTLGLVESFRKIQNCCGSKEETCRELGTREPSAQRSSPSIFLVSNDHDIRQETDKGWGLQTQSLLYLWERGILHASSGVFF